MSHIETLAIIQARMSSTRLPGKVMMPVMGRPLIEYQIERVLRAKTVDKLVLATTSNEDDDVLEGLCRKLNVACFRGSRDNVLERFYLAASEYAPKNVVRLTGDCPLSDPEIIDDVVGYYLGSGYDYVSNNLTACFPDGLDVEVFKFRALEESFIKAVLPSHLEHVTLYIRQNDIFSACQFPANCEYSGYRWTVDEPEDFEVVRHIIEALYSRNAEFDWLDVLHFIESRHDVVKINKRFLRNEGLIKSIELDKEYIKNQCV